MVAGNQSHRPGLKDYSQEMLITNSKRILIANGSGLDNEINHDAQAALNQTRQMIFAELIENVKALYQDATLSLAYYDAILLTVEK